MNDTSSFSSLVCNARAISTSSRKTIVSDRLTSFVIENERHKVDHQFNFARVNFGILHDKRIGANRLGNWVIEKEKESRMSSKVRAA